MEGAHRHSVQLAIVGDRMLRNDNSSINRTHFVVQSTLLCTITIPEIRALSSVPRVSGLERERERRERESSTITDRMHTQGCWN